MRHSCLSKTIVRRCKILNMTRHKTNIRKYSRHQVIPSQMYLLIRAGSVRLISMTLCIHTLGCSKAAPTRQSIRTRLACSVPTMILTGHEVKPRTATQLSQLSAPQCRNVNVSHPIGGRPRTAVRRPYLQIGSSIHNPLTTRATIYLVAPS